jgi:alpha-1,2-mannosyltransferase
MASVHQRHLSRWRSTEGSRTARWITPATLATTAAVFASFFLVALLGVHGDDLGSEDLLVYRAAGRAMLAGNSLYAHDFAAVNQSPFGLAFIYPPFSALLFIPLTIVPAGLAKVLMVLLNAAACTTFFGVIVVAAAGSWGRLASWRSLTSPIPVKTGIAVVSAAVVFVLSTPVEDTFEFGQVNLLLAAAVALDILLPHAPWPRGLLVGLAAAIKLTPAVFIGYFLLTRQWRALAVSLGTATSAMVVSWLVCPSDTTRFLSSMVTDPRKFGRLTFASNQSLRGVIARMPVLDSVQGVVWTVATVLVLALAAVAIWVSWRRGDVVAAMLSAALTGLLCAPVSWGHHWVWLSATAVFFLVRATVVPGFRNLAAGLAVAFVVLAAPWHSLPNDNDRERLWSPLEHLLGASWTLTAVLLLAWFATALSGSSDVAEVRDSAGEPTPQTIAEPGPLPVSPGTQEELERKSAGIPRRG